MGIGYFKTSYTPAYIANEKKDLLRYFRSRAFSLCGFSLPAFYEREFSEDLSDQPENNAAGSQAVQTTQGGVLRLQSGATATGIGGRILSYNLNTAYGHVPTGVSSVFYLASRMKLITTIDAQTILALYGSRGGGGPRIGAVGAASPTKFVASNFATGPDLVSNVNLDTSWHTFELWRVNSLTYFAVDGVIQASANSYISVAAPLAFYAQNGSTAANRGMDVDALLCAAERG